VRLKLISCEVLFREMCAVVARSPHQVDVEFLPKGLHDIGSERMCGQLQEAVDRVDSARYEAVLLGYALCGNGVAGLVARSLRLVIPRAHDCITLLLGSRDRYLSYFDQNSGVYFRSTGWLERGKSLVQLAPDSVRRNNPVGYSLDELVARYGEENGRYLHEQLNQYKRTYNQLTFIETGLEPDSSFEQQARAEAESSGWHFEKVQGDLSLLERLVRGDWDERDFLVVPPGARVTPTYDEGIAGFEGAGQ